MSDPCSPSQTCCPNPENNALSSTSPCSRKDLPPSVIGEVMTSSGPIPKVSSEMTVSDRLGIWKLRWGIGRMSYTVAPGLYALGQPDADSEVLVTANYQMTFDLLRTSLDGLDAWILVLDTDGVNVWCAAGKGTFGTDEIVKRLESARLTGVVNHKRLILPQLGAPGVAAYEVSKRTGFKIKYGPVEIKDLPAYLQNGCHATRAMRRKNFPLAERAAIVPMELVPASRWVLFVSLAVALISGILGNGTFLADALYYGSRSLLALVLGTLAGAVAAPIMLPWLPGRAFALKGALAGAAAALLYPVFVQPSRLELIAWTLVVISISSYFTMNFTGSSTYTSLSGVKKEMRAAVPFQITAVLAALVLWFTALFTAGGGTSL